jgi:hypothetical protein
MESGGITRKWLGVRDPAEVLCISAMILDIQRGQAEARPRNLEERRRVPDRSGRYLRLERLTCRSRRGSARSIGMDLFQRVHCHGGAAFGAYQVP